VVGLSFTSARLLLEHDGFVVVGRHARVGQTVTATSPTGHAPAGSVIVVFYGTGVLCLVSGEHFRDWSSRA
jgi:ribonuclease PH